MEFNTAKSLNFCIGPAGLSFGHRHSLGRDPAGDGSLVAPAPPGEKVWLAKPPANPADAAGAAEYDAKDIEPLRLGDWVGISGAAFTTGLGNVGGGGGTSLGTSLLCGLFNVRLGYWWQNGFSGASHEPLFPVQTYLFNEFTGHFDIQKNDRWYLSDGGHFENTAAYELIRRQVPFMVVADCGADRDGTFDDIGNLVRRVRLDFGAEVEFLDDDALLAKVSEEWLAPCVQWRSEKSQKESASKSNPAEPKTGGSDEPPAIAGRIGALADLRPFISACGRRRVRAHAAVARVTYLNSTASQSSLILFIKPGITDDLPADLVNYQQAQEDFPQQSTLNQFFDEPQWESYRKLGEYIADRLFAAPQTAGGKWSPGQFRNFEA